MNKTGYKSVLLFPSINDILSIATLLNVHHLPAHSNYTPYEKRESMIIDKYGIFSKNEKKQIINGRQVGVRNPKS